ncbi:MAG TPA: GTP-binding protein, partial [Anaerolineae bacterium]
MTIITGFLGSGKTSLLNHILHGDHGLRIAVLVNDFGEVNIDAGLIVGVEGETVSLANGCICCTIRGDLLRAVSKSIQQDNPPDYMIVETSGVSDPIAVAQTFLMAEVNSYVQVDGIITLVDAEQIRTLPGSSEMLAIDQVAAADIVVLNKVDLVSAPALQQVKEWIAEISPNARILETTYGKAPLELILSVGKYAPEKLAQSKQRDVHVHPAGEDTLHEHNQNHELVYNTWAYQTDEPLNRAALTNAIDRLPGTLFRVKGILWFDDAPESKSVLHVVGKRANLCIAGTWGDVKPASQIVAIGSAGGVDPDLLFKLFDACRASQ